MHIVKKWKTEIALKLNLRQGIWISKMVTSRVHSTLKFCNKEHVVYICYSYGNLTMRIHLFCFWINGFRLIWILRMTLRRQAARINVCSYRTTVLVLIYTLWILFYTSKVFFTASKSFYTKEFDICYDTFITIVTFLSYV